MFNSTQHALSVVKRGFRGRITNVTKESFCVPYTRWLEDGIRGLAMDYLSSRGKAIRVFNDDGYVQDIYQIIF